MSTAGGCFVCGGTPDMSHSSTHGYQDHHGGGIVWNNELVAFNLFGLEWSLGWSANPAAVKMYVTRLNALRTELGMPAIPNEIETTADVMNYVDSDANASVKLCAPHHLGSDDADTRDINGNQAVGIHCCPFPIWLGQVTCDWSRWDMWGGTTGTVALAPHPHGAVVVHVSSLHPDISLYHKWRAGHEVVLPHDHVLTRAANKYTEKQDTQEDNHDS
jgi:hypothetical protein